MAASHAMKAPHPQTQSRLLSLPAEFRTYIYELVLAVPPNQNGRVVVSDANDRFRLSMSSKSRREQQSPKTGSTETVLRLLETCRLVNGEAAGIFYSQHRLQLSYRCLAESRRFFEVVSQTRLKNVRFLAIPALDLLDAAEACGSPELARLPHLETLVFTELYVLDFMSARGSVTKFVRASFLKSLRNLAKATKTVFLELRSDSEATPGALSEVNSWIAKFLAGNGEEVMTAAVEVDYTSLCKFS